MDPIHPIIPQAPTMPPVAPSPGAQRSTVTGRAPDPSANVAGARRTGAGRA